MDAPRAVSASQDLLDAKQNVKLACRDLNRHPGLGDDFSERINDLLDLCVPKEESVSNVSYDSCNRTTDDIYRRTGSYRFSNPLND